jgi:hypothetical protein
MLNRMVAIDQEVLALRYFLTTWLRRSGPGARDR